MARKYLSFLQLFVIILTACTSKQKKSINKKEESHFSYFELSYKGDWFGGFSFLVDTNKIFFFPSTLPQISGDKIKYGILPDSLFQAIDSTITQIRTLQSLNPDSTYCFDCSEVSIKAILNSDTIRLYQAGIINDTIWNLIEKLMSDCETKSVFSSF